MTAYSRQPRAIQATRAFLICYAGQVPDDATLPTYADVAATYGGIAGAAGPVLNSVRRDCDQAGEPDLSALVIDKQTGLPGAFKSQPVAPGTPAEARWRNELDLIRRHTWE